MAHTEPVRIVIADDHPIFRDGLRRLLDAEKDLQVVGEAEDGMDVLNAVQLLKPDLLLLDLAMPRMTGLDALKELARTTATAKVVVLTASADSRDKIAALQHGAKGVVLKGMTTGELFRCIRSVMDGHCWVDGHGHADPADVLRKLTDADERQRAPKTFGLTRRELEIVGAIVSGSTNKDIARKLSISEDTVKHHLTNVFDKTGVSNRLELALFAVHHTLVDLP